MKICLQKDVYAFHNDTGSMWAGPITPGDKPEKSTAETTRFAKVTLCAKSSATLLPFTLTPISGG